MTIKQRVRDPRMPALAKNEDDLNSRLTAVTLHTSIGGELRVVDLRKGQKLPRVIVWEWRTFLQELSSETSRRYFECDSHFFYG